MANRNTPISPKHKGWYLDQVNNLLEIYFNTTKAGHFNSSGQLTLTDGSTTYMSNGVVASSGLAGGGIYIARLGTHAAIASNGAGAILPDTMLVAPAALRIISAWKSNISASDVTKGTATTSASFRRFNLITNTAATGTGTDIVGSLNATASLASLFTRAFTPVASTVPAGAIVLVSHLTVGAETADGTDAAAGIIEVAYQYV